MRVLTSAPLATLALGALLSLAATGCSTTSTTADAPVTGIPSAGNPLDAAAGMETVDFGAIMQGIRPRGFGAVPYTLRGPSSGGRVWYVAPTGDDSANGTSSTPLRTINRAAQLAVAGDVVTIRPGTYEESVIVQNSGTATRPIVFQAEQRGGTVLTGGAYRFSSKSWTGGVDSTGEFYVWVRGLVFRQYSDSLSEENAIAAVQASTGWQLEDDLFDDAGRTGAELRGNNIRVVRCTFQRNFINALMAWGPTADATSTTDTLYQAITGLRLTDLVIRWNNTTPDPLTGDVAEYVAKLWGTYGAEIDNVESYENNGPGLWFDTNNAKFIVRNSYIHDNRGVAGVDSRGRGIFIEANWAPGLVERSVFLNNSGAAVTVANSQGVEVRYSLMSGNAYCVALMNSHRTTLPDGTPLYPLKSLNIRNNRCRDWKLSGAIATVGGTFVLPLAMSLRSDSTVYEPVTDPGLVHWSGVGIFETIDTVQKRLGWEMHGSVGPVTVPVVAPAP